MPSGVLELQYKQISGRQVATIMIPEKDQWLAVGVIVDDNLAFRSRNFWFSPEEALEDLKEVIWRYFQEKSTRGPEVGLGL